MLRSGLVVSVLVGATISAAGCSLLFEPSKNEGVDGTVDASTGSTGDGGTVDASIPPLSTCTANLPGTIGYFPIDGEGGKAAIVDTIGGVLGRSIKKTTANKLVDAPLDAQLRTEEGCGDAARLDGVVNGTFVLIDESNYKFALSLDFWFNTESIANGGSLGGLLTADGEEDASGDMGLFLFRSDDPDGGYHVLLLMQDGMASYYGCSDSVDLNVWNHVAVSFDGSNGGAKLFVNGLLANNMAAFMTSSSMGEFYCGAGDVARNATIVNSPRGWMWGASNAGSETDVARDGITGLVDDLRFRSQPFTQADAQMVYESLPLPTL